MEGPNERAAKALHDDDRPAPGVPHAARLAPRAQVAMHGPMQYAGHRRAEVVAPRQEVPDPRRQGQDPLPDGDLRPHIIESGSVDSHSPMWSS